MHPRGLMIIRNSSPIQAIVTHLETATAGSSGTQIEQAKARPITSSAIGRNRLCGERDHYSLIFTTRFFLVIRIMSGTTESNSICFFFFFFTLFRHLLFILQFLMTSKDVN